MATSDWAADGKKVGGDDLLEAFRRLKTEHDKTSQQYIQELERLLGITGKPPPQTHGSYNTYPPFSNIQELNEALRQKKAAQPAKPVVNPEARRKEIEQELDIIRGRVPTPKGYTVNPGRVKALLVELKTLSEK